MSDSMEVEKKKKKKKDKKKETEHPENGSSSSSSTPASSSASSSSSSDEDSLQITDVSTVRLSPIASPLADKKLTKKLLKLVRKASKVKALRRGVKEVVKAIRKGEKGVMIIAGNITPIDVITHLPVLCEENGIPYIYVPAKEDLGAAGSTKRPTSCVLIQKKKDQLHSDYYDEVREEVLTQQIAV